MNDENEEQQEPQEPAPEPDPKIQHKKRTVDQ